jgi:glycosyltransferase involved in cell wall biosynthesis
MEQMICNKPELRASNCTKKMTRSKTPLVSAVVICYNHARFLVECLEAIKQQTYRNVELIIVDDFSTDNSTGIIRAWLKQCPFPHKFVEHVKNQRICRSLNDAIAQVKGDYISHVAADDFWLPEKLERQVRIMEATPQAGVLYSDVYVVDEQGASLPRGTYIPSQSPHWPPPEGNILDSLWRHGNWIPPMGTLIRRKCYGAVGLYDESLWHEDYDMWLRMAEQFEFKFSDWVSAKYRVVATSMVRSSWPKICESSVQMCLKHLKRKDLPKRVRPLVRQQLKMWAKRCYASGSRNCRKSMLASALKAPHPDLIVPTVFAVSGMSFQRYERVRNLCAPRRHSDHSASPS